MSTIRVNVSEKENDAIEEYAQMCGESVSELTRKVLIQEITFMKSGSAKDPESYEHHMLVPIDVSKEEENLIIETNYNKIREILGWKKINLWGIDMDGQNQGSQTTAIIIDDDHDIASVFKEYLELYGITTLGIGHNGKSAVELYQKIKPSIVLLDVMMPDYDGFYGLGKIKQLDPSAKVIMATADATQESRDRLTSLGADAVLHKPFEVKEIRAAINRITQLGVGNN